MFIETKVTARLEHEEEILLLETLTLMSILDDPNKNIQELLDEPTRTLLKRLNVNRQQVPGNTALSRVDLMLLREACRELNGELRRLMNSELIPFPEKEYVEENHATEADLEQDIPTRRRVPFFSSPEAYQGMQKGIREPQIRRTSQVIEFLNIAIEEISLQEAYLGGSPPG